MRDASDATVKQELLRFLRIDGGASPARLVGKSPRTSRTAALKTERSPEGFGKCVSVHPSRPRRWTAVSDMPTNINLLSGLCRRWGKRSICHDFRAKSGLRASEPRMRQHGHPGPPRAGGVLGPPPHPGGVPGPHRGGGRAGVAVPGRVLLREGPGAGRAHARLPELCGAARGVAAPLRGGLCAGVRWPALAHEEGHGGEPLAAPAGGARTGPGRVAPRSPGAWSRRVCAG
eukprot:scaffold334_cov241-Pinguiococcus_pyrenoidosus.AAC.29